MLIRQKKKKNQVELSKAKTERNNENMDTSLGEERANLSAFCTFV